MRCSTLALLVCLAFPLIAFTSEPLAQPDVAGRVLDLVRTVGEYSRAAPEAAGAFPAWAVVEVTVAEPLLVHRYPELEPSYFIAPVVDDEGRPTSFVTVDARTGEWHAYWEAGAVVEFPAVNRVRAAEIASREFGIECAPDGLRAVSMPNKRLYWYLKPGIDGPEIFVGLGDPPGVHVGLDPYLDPPMELEGRPQGTEPGRGASGRARPHGRYPPSYEIEGVPFHYQQTNYNCGPAALEMVFDYCGPDINQTDIAHAANTNSASGTHARDLRRAAHFSYVSTSVQWPYIQGYAERSLGYAAAENRWSLGADYADRYNDLKTLISSDCPILVLTYYDENHGPYGPNHFRVVKGYDDSTSVFIVHDPWDPNLGPGAYWGPDVHFNQVFFVDDLWRTYDRWGLFTAPWDLECTAPSSLLAGVEFTVTAAVFYPGPHPFEGDYAATNPAAEIVLPPGLSLPVGETAVKALPGIGATGTADTVSWQVMASCDAGPTTITVRANGRVVGACPSYPSGYVDDIGGEGEAGIELASRVIYVDVNGTGDFLTIWEGIDATWCSGDSVIVLPGTYTGEGNKNIQFDEDVNIALVGLAGSGSTVIDCEGVGRGFVFYGSDTTAVVSGFTVRNGDVTTFPEARSSGSDRQWYEYTGGGILCFESSPRLRDLVVEGCTAYAGGGISWVGSWPNIENARIAGNAVPLVTNRQFSGHGGGAYLDPSEQVEPPRASSAYDTVGRFRNVEFVGNTAGLSGGGLCAASFTGNLWDVTALGNSAPAGGGMLMDACAPLLERTLFARNVADRGAAILFDGAWEGQGSPEIIRTTVAYNDAAPEWSAVEWAGGDGDISRAIISHTVEGSGMMCTSGGELYGCYLDVYGNAGGDSICVEEWKRYCCMSYDPLYCDAGANDFTLYDDSRCLPENNDWEQLIGRYGAGGCGQSGVDEPPRPAGVLTLHCPAPNPARGTAEIHYEAPPSAVDLTVSIYNLRGQLVRVLCDGVVSAGPGRLVWDGTDEAGHPVASGVYFVRAAFGAEEASRKLVVLR